MGRTIASGTGGAQGKGRAETLAHIILGQATVMVLVQGIKHGIGPKPFITGDAAIAIEIIQQENLLNGMAKGTPSSSASRWPSCCSRVSMALLKPLIPSLSLSEAMRSEAIC